MKKVAIIGAGNGGVCMGAYISLRGGKVNIYDKFPQALESLKENKGIELRGVSLNGFAEFDIISENIEDVIRDCQLIMVVTPAFAHRDIAKSCAEFLVDGQTIVLHPGRTGGALEFYKTVKDINPTVNVNIAEAQTLVYACRRTKPDQASIFGVKEKVSVAAIPSKDTKKVVHKLNEYYEQFVSAEDVLETSLLNIGAIFHPTPSILNVARMECKEDFEYYHQGITPSVGEILQKIDEERMKVANAFKVNTISTIEWLKQVYGVEGNTIYDSVKLNKAYSGIAAPKNSSTRYITEDVPMSLTPISELGKLVKVKTPVIDMIIRAASIIHNVDYRSTGRTMERMGISGMSSKEIKLYVRDPDIYNFKKLEERKVAL
ncbi:NAD/NADP-dependent octopine/nopaline dehydrogenase family protein [Maledivibacter halophilus]|uniref:Opine dehydrogenase n=1 Tax=Maledivibacter halophilus TaxID=36842 RepID=A0A1T5IRN3_9FIRM|nr:NAD/NADP-dependent octopine/nopaline dehydrogenase family protein [Maledivibacter halophilus]SKC41811.1 opine dehydrogenase [Maledivibacter halophilus]